MARQQRWQQWQEAAAEAEAAAAAEALEGRQQRQEAAAEAAAAAAAEAAAAAALPGTNRGALQVRRQHLRSTAATDSAPTTGETPEAPRQGRVAGQEDPDSDSDGETPGVNAPEPGDTRRRACPCCRWRTCHEDVCECGGVAFWPIEHYDPIPEDFSRSHGGDIAILLP